MRVLTPFDVDPTRKPLCEGRLATSLRVVNDSVSPAVAEVYEGGKWKNMGLLGYKDSTAFWRAAGEPWRLRCYQTGKILAQIVTASKPQTLLHAPETCNPYKYMWRHTPGKESYLIK